MNFDNSYSIAYVRAVGLAQRHLTGLFSYSKASHSIIATPVLHDSSSF